MSIALSSITDSLAFFELEDQNYLKKAARPIYGRSREIKALMTAYRKVAESSQRQTVCLHGSSGSGKTALVENLRDSLCDTNRSYFCAGKYFQNAGIQEPFSAIMAAFSDLCDLVSQDCDFDDARREKIKRQLGPDGHLLKKSVSNLTPFLENNPEKDVGQMSDYRSDGAAGKFKIACKTFLRAMASLGRPIIVFLDDIQWMDEGSRNLIESLLNDSELLNVFFILAFRDEEKFSVDKTLCKLQAQQLIDLPLNNLNVYDVGELIASTMKKTKGFNIQPLAELVAARTSGNPFHVLQFMETIVREGLLAFDSEVDSWVYDVDEIQREIMVCDTLADLLLRKIQVLPKEEQEALKIASLLGYEFDIDILTSVMKVVQEDPVSTSRTEQKQVSICTALEFGIIERSKDLFIFSHDKLQSSFQDMLSHTEQQQMHGIIGEIYLSCNNSNENAYYAAVHVKEAFDENEKLDGRLVLAQVILDASKHCIDRSAFGGAVSLLRWALELIEKNELWTSDFDLAFALTETLAKMELIVGNLDACKSLTTEALLRARSLDMKINSLLIDVQCHMAGNQMSASTESACRALADLDVRMPRKVFKRHVLTKLLRVRRLLYNKNDEDILQLPLVQDRAIAVASRVLIMLAWYCMLQDETLTGVYSTLYVTEMTLLYGLSSHSASALIIYAIVELNFGNATRADRFGKIGIRVMDQLKNRETECMAICSWVSALAHWTCPIKELQKPINQAVESGFDTGDPLYTAIAIANVFSLALCVGEDMEEIERSMRVTYDKLCDLSKSSMLLWAQCPFQLVLNHRRTETADWRALTNLTGEVMNEGEYIREVVQANHPTLIVMLWICKANLCFNFGFTQQAADLYADSTERAKIFRHNYTAMHLYYYASLTYYQLYRETSQRKHLKAARKWQKCLRRIQVRGSPNVRFLTLLEAEHAASRKPAKVEYVMKAYDHAIAVMKEERNMPKEALASERAGFALTHFGFSNDALNYFEHALHLYKYFCGAPAKFEWLQEKVNLMSLSITGEPENFPAHLSLKI